MEKRIPSVDDFMRLRAINGLSPRSREGARRGLPNSLFALCVIHGDEVIGMGRIIGDGGCNYEIVDVAVDPRFQGRGLGKRVMQGLIDWVRAEAPPSAYVDLIADVPPFYEKLGFRSVAPSEGMCFIT